MFTSKSIQLLAALVVTSVLLAGVAQAQQYNLADDWSDVNNPNGPWTLDKAPGQLFTVVQPDWYGNGTNQPAWADAPGPDPFPPNPLAPMWAKAIGDVGTLTGDAVYSSFVDAGTVIMHSAEDFRTGTDFSSLVWTSPGTGTAHIDGGLWIAKAFDRPHQWELRKNGISFTSGGLSQADPYDKTNPFLFAAGSGGASAVDVAVAQNDELELLIYKSGSYYTPGTFVGMNYQIRFVPEPTSLGLGLMTLGLMTTTGLMAARPRRRRCIESNGAGCN